MVRFFRALMVVVIVVALSVAGVSTAVTNELTRPAAPLQPADDKAADEPEGIEFTIAEEESITEIAHKLRANGLIRNVLLFRFVVAQRGEDYSFQPGTYTLRRDMSMQEILATLQPVPASVRGEGAP
jgi:UPF0755 protein